MIAAVATVAFLFAAWAALYVAVRSADDSGSKVLAALKGRSLLAQPMILRPVTVRYPSRLAARTQPVRVKAEWRAAA